MREGTGAPASPLNWSALIRIWQGLPSPVIVGTGMKVIISIALGVGLTVLAVIFTAYSGWYNVSALADHYGIVRWLLETTREQSVEQRAGAVTMPDLTAERRTLAGAQDFDAMCAGCHGAPGREPGPVGQGLNPNPPDLAEAAQELTAAEVFWITRHGIRMTGMPAWGASHDDHELWSVVAFVMELPNIDAEQYRRLTTVADDHSGSSHGGHTH